MANKTGIKLLVAAAVVAVGYFVVSYALRPVAVVHVAASGKVARAVSAQIKVRAENALEVKLEATGRMLNELKEGQAVAQDDPLVEIDTRLKVYEIEQLESDLRAAKAQREIQAKGEANVLRREKASLALKELDKNAGRLSVVAYDQLAARVEDMELTHELNQILATAGFEKSENLIKIRKQELANMSLKAPFAGSLTDIKTPKGALVSGGQTVATLLSHTRIIEARISEENMAQGVAVGQRVRVWFTGIPDDYYGTVTKILPAQDPQTLRYVAHLQLNVGNEKLDKTGLSGEGVITIDEKQAAVVVPEVALHNNRLYVVTEGRVEVRSPKVGYDSGGMLEILSGLQAGDAVIVDRQDLFQDGQRVRTRSAE